MHQRGFGAKRMNLIQSLLYKGSVGVRINDVNSNFFEAGQLYLSFTI